MSLLPSPQLWVSFCPFTMVLLDVFHFNWSDCCLSCRSTAHELFITWSWNLRVRTILVSVSILIWIVTWPSAQITRPVSHSVLNTPKVTPSICLLGKSSTASMSRWTHSLAPPNLNPCAPWSIMGTEVPMKLMWGVIRKCHRRKVLMRVLTLRHKEPSSHRHFSDWL